MDEPGCLMAAGGAGLHGCCGNQPGVKRWCLLVMAEEERKGWTGRAGEEIQRPSSFHLQT